MKSIIIFEKHGNFRVEFWDDNKLVKVIEVREVDQLDSFFIPDMARFVMSE